MMMHDYRHRMMMIAAAAIDTHSTISTDRQTHTLLTCP